MSRDVDQIIKEKLRNLEKEPPSYIWSAINNQMLENRHKKRVLIFWQSVAAVALIVLSLGITYLFTENKQAHEQTAVIITPEPASINTGKKSSQQSKSHKTDITEPKNTAFTTNKGTTTKQHKTASPAGVEIKAAKASNVVKNKDIKLASASKTVSISKSIPVNTNETPSKIPAFEKSEMQKLHHTATLSAFAGNNVIKAPGLTTTNPSGEKVIYPLYAANNTPAYQKKTKKHKFIISGSLSPTYNYRNLGGSQSPAATNYDNNTFDETGVVSIAGGVNIRMESKSRWSFETGVLYSQVGQEVSQTNMLPSISGVSSLALYSDTRKLKNTAVNLSNTTSNSLGNISFPDKTPMAVEKSFQRSGVYLVTPMETLDQQPATTTLKQLLDYIEIPLVVRYALLDSKTLITLSGGVSTNFLVDNTAYLTEDGQQTGTGSTDGISPVTYSSSVGLGIEMPIGKSFRFMLEPRFKYFLSPVNSNGYNNYHPYSFGVFGGISFLLNGH